MKEYPVYIGKEQNFQSEKRKIVSPYKNKEVGLINLAGEEHIEKAIAKAVNCFRGSQKIPSHKRYEILKIIAEDITRKSEQLSEILALECGKNIKFAKGEVERAIQTFTIAAEESKRIPGEFFSLDAVEKGKGKSALVRRFPIGPVLGITPFNFPLNLVAHKVAPAIAVGNPIIIKPSSLAPLSALNLAEIVSNTRRMVCFLCFPVKEQISKKQFVILA